MINPLLLESDALVVFRGESKTLRLEVTQSSVAVDLTGAVVYFTVKQGVSDRDPLFQKTSTEPTQIEITNPRAGVANILLTPVDTANLDAGDYIYDVWIHYTATGKRFPVVYPSTFRVELPVTRISF